MVLSPLYLKTLTHSHEVEEVAELTDLSWSQNISVYYPCIDPDSNDKM